MQNANLLCENGYGNILGLSGGGDSVYLLLAVVNELKGRDNPLAAVHVNHELRGEAADGDEEFCRQLCAGLGVRFVSRHVNVRELAGQRKQTLEQAGRQVRYDIFYEEARRMMDMTGVAGVNILLAHHANDQEETVLMNMLRGSGLSGLCGMRPVQKAAGMGNVRLVRPLLEYTHRELLDRLLAMGQEWREDATNALEDCTRNRLRNRIIPQIKEISPGFTAICQREARLFRQIQDYMETEADGFLNGCAHCENGVISVPADRLRKLHPALLAEVIRRCVDRVSGLKDIGAVHTEQIAGLLEKESGRRVMLPGGLLAAREFDNVCIYSKNAASEEKEPRFFWEICAADGADYENNLKKFQNECYTKWLDYDKIIRYCGSGEPVLRRPEAGDFLLINSKGQKKKLLDYLGQEKIPLRSRAGVPVVAWNSVILWVVGHRPSAYFFVDQDTRNILKISVSQ